MQASVRTVKNRFSEFLRRASKGEEIVVTSHNRPVAKLVPLSSAETTNDTGRQEFLADLAELRASLAGRTSGAPLSQVVLELRKNGRY